MEQEQKYSAEEIISSIDGMERAEPNHFLLTRIRQQLRNQEGFLPPRLKKLLVPAYAALAIFLVLNVYSYIHFNSKTKTPGQTITNQNPGETLASEYNLQTSIY